MAFDVLETILDGLYTLMLKASRAFIPWHLSTKWSINKEVLTFYSWWGI